MKCIACDSDFSPVKSWKTNSISSEKTYQIEFCKCGLGKTIIDDLKEIEESNIDQYNNLESRINIYFKNLHNHITIRYSQALTEISKYTNNRKLLEVGSNIGFTLNIAKSRGFEVTGCEINKKCQAFSELVYNQRILNDFFEIDEKFDILIMNDVLEHFPNPALAIKKAHDLLTENGIIFIQLPNIESKRAKKMKGEWDYLLAPDHTFHFSQKSLSTMLKNNNFIEIWNRRASGVYDMAIIKFLPKKIQNWVNYFLNNNPFYYPGLYSRKNGELIQSIYQKK